MASVDVIFTGRVLPGVDPNQAASDLCRLTGLDFNKGFAAIISGQPQLAIQGLTADHGRAWLSRVIAVGVEAHLRPSSVPPDNSFGPPLEYLPLADVPLINRAPEGTPLLDRESTRSPGDVFVNSIGMEFVLIPAGKFWMGSADDDEAAYDDAKPRHEVTISRPFYLGKYPVTQAQWEVVMGNNPSEFKGANRPVEDVSWEDVQEFIAKLNAKEGHNRNRLPTEAEWEYACRAGSTSRFCFGDDEGRLRGYAWYEDNAGEETHPVGRKQPNAWGLYDMHGNVWEWVQDWYDGYSAEAAVDPQGAAADGDRVLRGGSWNDVARHCRAASRDGDSPDSRGSHIGFRLALSPGH